MLEDSRDEASSCLGKELPGKALDHSLLEIFILFHGSTSAIIRLTSSTAKPTENLVCRSLRHETALGGQGEVVEDPCEPLFKGGQDLGQGAHGLS